MEPPNPNDPNSADFHDMVILDFDEDQWKSEAKVKYPDIGEFELDQLWCEMLKNKIHRLKEMISH